MNNAGCSEGHAPDSGRYSMTRHGLMIIIAIMVVMTIGCTSPAPLRDDYGRSVRAMKQAQRPDSARMRGMAPMEGLDGRAAQAVIQQYLGTFDKANEGAPSAAPLQMPSGINEAVGATGSPPGGNATSP